MWMTLITVILIEKKYNRIILLVHIVPIINALSPM